MKCGAKTRNGTPCRRDAMPNGRCYLHGGATPVGPANPNFKHGRYSKYVPERLRERYESGLSDPELLELHSEISLLDSRLSDLLSQADSGGSQNEWSTATKLWKRIKTARETGDINNLGDLEERLTDLLERTESGEEVWKDIQRVIEQRRKLVDTEQRRMVSTKQMVTVEQAMTLLAMTIEALKEAVYRHAEPNTARSIIVDASASYRRLVDSTGEG